MALKRIQLEGGDVSLVRPWRRAHGSTGCSIAPRLPRTVAEAVDSFSRNCRTPAIRAPNDAELVRSLIRHHERVQAGKLDASRQPKRPWAGVERERGTVIDPRYAPDERTGPAGQH